MLTRHKNLIDFRSIYGARIVIFRQPFRCCFFEPLSRSLDIHLRHFDIENHEFVARLGVVCRVGEPQLYAIVIHTVQFKLVARDLTARFNLLAADNLEVTTAEHTRLE
jgi:hypothetical protein